MLFNISFRTGGWSADSSDTNPWIQANFGGVKVVSTILTRGLADEDEWVTSYTVSYTTESASTNWLTITNATGSNRTFTANTDSFLPVVNELPSDVIARHVRLTPITWHNHVSMRILFYGCNYTGGKQLRN